MDSVNIIIQFLNDGESLFLDLVIIHHVEFVKKLGIQNTGF